MANPVTWFEINGPNPDATATFYAELFGWHTEKVPGDVEYTLIDTHAGGGMNGGLGATEGEAAYAVFYVENPDITSLQDTAVSMGATAVVPVTETEMVTFSRFTDPFGNLVGLVQGDGATNVSAGDRPPVDWFEVSVAEPEKAWDFYRRLFGWTVEGGDASGQFLHAGVNPGGGVRGGIGSSPDGRPHVVLYASVDDVPRYLERAMSLGATTVMPPTKVDEHTTIAAFVDPEGTMFGVYASEG